MLPAVLLRACIRTWQDLERCHADTSWLTSTSSPVQNAGNKYAGSITAALFLQQYVDTEKVQWAHIDIAGYGRSLCLYASKAHLKSEWSNRSPVLGTQTTVLFTS